MKTGHWVVFTGSLLIIGLMLVGQSLASELRDSTPGTQPPVRDVVPVERPDVMPIRPVEMRVGLDILVDGEPLAVVHHAGKDYLPVPRVGEEYEIRVWNNGPRRVVAVVSVDGLSVISGKRASETDSGYVVAPHSSVLIQGWRRNMETAAAFRFVDREKSYAAKEDKPENIGVIGLVAFEEAVRLPRPLLGKAESAGPAAPILRDGAMRMPRDEVGSIGTEYGREVDSRIYYVPFVRSNHKRTITLYYDTRAKLREAGVPLDRPRHRPVPFPDDSNFAPPPPGYKGG